MPATDVTLTCGDMSLTLSLQGAGILGFRRGQQELMIPPYAQPRLASFVMVPFCSRVTGGRFHYARQQVQLTPNFVPEPHCIHGFGWQSRWRIQDQEANSCTLTYSHDVEASGRTGWPWRFHVAQHFALSEVALSHTVTVENASDTAMPVGAGYHPHLPLSPTSEIHLACQGELALDDDGLPWTGQSREELSGPADLVNPLKTRPWLDKALDQVYVWRQGPAKISWPEQPYSLVIEPDAALPHWVVYAPKGENFICIEPISHLPNALNLFAPGQSEPGAMVNLDPGAQWSVGARFVTCGPD